MAFPIKTCVVCGEIFELRPGKPGYANRCPECSAEETRQVGAERGTKASESNAEMDAERRKAIRNLLYRKES